MDKVLYRIAEIEGMGSQHSMDDWHSHNPDAPSCSAKSAGRERRVSFSNDKPKSTANVDDGKEATRARSPPPPEPTYADEDDDADDESVDDEDDGLGLTRFASASGQPPRDAGALETTTTSTTHTQPPSQPHSSPRKATRAISPPPPLSTASSSSSSSDSDDDDPPIFDEADPEDDDESPPTSPDTLPSDEEIEKLFRAQPSGDKDMADLYHSVANCGCQTQRGKNSGPNVGEVGSIWALRAEREKRREDRKGAEKIKVRAVVRFAA